MVDSSQDTYRLRLEGRAELLESALRRYRELVEALRAPRWEERVRGMFGTVRGVGAEQERVDAALVMALRRAQAEAWPERSPTVRLLHETRGLREAFIRAVAAKVGTPGLVVERTDARHPHPVPLPLGAEQVAELMHRLEDHVRRAPRVVPPAQRWAVAVEALPEDLPALRDVAAFGALLRSVFSEPFDLMRPLPFRAEDLQALREQWPRGEAALAECWTRLAGVDPTGGVVGEVRRRSGREPLHAPQDGPARLVLAEYWFSTTQARLEYLVRARLAPLQPSRQEWREVALWLCERGISSDARLQSSASVGELRAGLLELAYELWEALHAELPEPERWPELRWERMAESARRAEPGANSEDARKLRHILRERIQARGMGAPMLRGWWEPSSLEELVLQARTVMSGLDGG